MSCHRLSYFFLLLGAFFPNFLTSLPITRSNPNLNSQALTTKDNLIGYFSKLDYSLFDPTNCSAFHSDKVDEVRSYKAIVNSIVFEATIGSYRGRTYNQLADFVDTFSSRLSGSVELENSIEYLRVQMQNPEYGFTNVHTEEVPNIPGWKRGIEYAQIITPKRKMLSILGLGLSASTPILGIKGEVVIFNSYVDVIRNSFTARNKIAVCNFGGPPSNVLNTIDNGYSYVASSGALAVLYRSAATFSMDSPHTRRANLYYDGISREIPIAYLSLEDADLLSRMGARGQKTTIYLNMQSSNKTKSSKNLFGDLEGREKPSEYVILSAHTDGWDVGQSAQDDGVGIYSTMEALSLLKSLNLIPRRTIRAAMWTAEEYGFLGSQKYISDQEHKFDKLNLALEADYGCLESVGLIYNGKYEMGCILHEILNLLEEAKASRGLLIQSDTYRTDLDNFQDAGIPVVSLNGDDGTYFWYHHTAADTMTAVNSNVLDRCMATWAATSYVLADLKEMVPKGFDPIHP